MNIRCSTTDCPHGAKYAPKICIPATGWPIDMHKPIELVCGVKLCKECMDKMKADDWLGPELDKPENKGTGKNLREIVTIMTRGHMPPDFDRAWIEPLLLSSKEFAEFEKGLNKVPGAVKDGGTVH